LGLTEGAKYRHEEKTELALQGLISRGFVQWHIPKVRAHTVYTITPKGRAYLNT
jgi:hypothetical protein